MKLNWETLLYWILALFCLFVIYQTLRYIFGGSWALEGLVIAFLIANFTIIISQTGKISRFEGEFNEFKRSMLTLAKDFKEFREEMREFKHEMLHFKKETERDLGRLRHLMK